MLETLVLTRLDQLRALSDPVRLRVLDALIEREGTVQTLAVELGEPASRLYPHVDLLLESGLVEVARRLRRRGAEQRFLRAVAADFVLDRRLLTAKRGKAESLATLLEVARSMLSGAAEDLTDGVRDGTLDPGKPGRSFFIDGRALTLSAEAFRELPAALAAAGQRAEQRGSGSKQRYRLVLVAYPADLADAKSPRKASTSRRASNKKRS